MKKILLPFLFFLMGFIIAFYIYKDCQNETSYVIIENQNLACLGDKKIPSAGVVKNKEMAVSLAISFFKEFLNLDNSNYEKFEVKFENEAWIVKGIILLGKTEKGGNSLIEIRKSDGAILNFIHGR